MQITNPTARTSRRLGTLLMIRRSHAADPKPIRPDAASGANTVDDRDGKRPVRSAHPEVVGPVAGSTACDAGPTGGAARTRPVFGHDHLDAAGSTGGESATDNVGAVGDEQESAATPAGNLEAMLNPSLRKSLRVVTEAAISTSAASSTFGEAGSMTRTESRDTRDEGTPPAGGGEPLIRVPMFWRPPRPVDAVLADRSGTASESVASFAAPPGACPTEISTRLPPTHAETRAPGPSNPVASSGPPEALPVVVSGKRALLRPPHAGGPFGSGVSARRRLLARRLRLLRVGIRRRLPRTAVTAWADRHFAAAIAGVLSSAARMAADGPRAFTGRPAGGRLRGLRVVRRIRVVYVRTTVGIDPGALATRPGVVGYGGARSPLRRTWAVLRDIGRRLLVRLIRALRADDGMSTAEYAIGTIAAAAFGAVLYGVVTGDSIVDALTGIIDKALNTSV